MPRFVIAYHSASSGTQIQVLDAESRDQALRAYFDRFSVDYSKDSEGFAYFREDFEDPEQPAGALLEIAP